MRPDSSLIACLGLLLACDAAPSATHGAGAAEGAGAGQHEGAADPGTSSDADCLTDAEEATLGTDPLVADSDADGLDDCAERDCVSDPLDAAEQCYACGWPHGDPGTLVATGAEVGDVIANMALLDQCREPIHLWDFAGEYRILMMTTTT